MNLHGQAGRLILISVLSSWGFRSQIQPGIKIPIIHELTHILVGQFTFSCIGTLPGWIEEGLAMFSEGELDSIHAIAT